MSICFVYGVTIHKTTNWITVMDYLTSLYQLQIYTVSNDKWRDNYGRWIENWLLQNISGGESNTTKILSGQSMTRVAKILTRDTPKWSVIYTCQISQTHSTLNNFCRILTMVCWYWTNCTFGLYPCLVSQKIEELKIYIPNITIHTSTKFTPGSITNHRATYLGAYTHKPLKKVRHQWQWVTQLLHTSQLLKPGKHKYRIQTKAHAHPHNPGTLDAREKPRWQLGTQLLTDKNTQGGPKYQYKYTQTHNGTHWPNHYN
jgi:hypothetical protein